MSGRQTERVKAFRAYLLQFGFARAPAAGPFETDMVEFRSRLRHADGSCAVKEDGNGDKSIQF